MKEKAQQKLVLATAGTGNEGKSPQVFYRQHCVRHQTFGGGTGLRA